MTEAASLPLVALTAWQALIERAHVQPGQKVFIHAGAGGLGSIAVQLAKALGAYVATTASTAKVDLVKELGADEVIDYRTQDFTEVLHDYDVVLDSLGGENLAKSLRVLKPGGQAISVVGPPDPASARELGSNPVLRLAVTALRAKTRRQAKRLGVTYAFLFMKASGAQLRERPPHRHREDPPRRRPRLPVRRNPPGHGIRREGTSKGRQSRRRDDVRAETSPRRQSPPTATRPCTPHSPATPPQDPAMSTPSSSPAPMSYKNTPNRSVSVRGVTFAYRRLGPDDGIPLILLNHLSAVLDNWGPRVVDGLAARRPVITIDNRGVGASGGSTPDTIEAMARDTVLFIWPSDTTGSTCSACRWAASSPRSSRQKNPTLYASSSSRARDPPEAPESTRSQASPSRTPSRPS
ncbi:Phenolphthiocerol synthesis polyketide synthase type I Pks15/1 [Streptomyces fradiae ATCC 10745 = DSM 40063]|uniref:Phenolphthiocerol synthesis polyketide synthase type I Pks15/1 n=1 Tax=Streptomyces fradiae ATCC 10745 = DSM 40063 TaxID=1319510 RepID=A0A1Y2NPR9_STRFR|nr:Phenolphthiocerol synthesis polyketide synthase type I Pks15/1 [Streptomyces fradiae ATCC 10745 = DSM 40063]